MSAVDVLSNFEQKNTLAIIILVAAQHLLYAILRRIDHAQTKNSKFMAIILLLGITTFAFLLWENIGYVQKFC